MNEYDCYIVDYLIHNFKNMRADLFPRDFDTENKIITASKIEYLLESSQDSVLKAFGSMDFKAHNGNNYKIEFNNEWFFRIICVDEMGNPKNGIGDKSLLEELGICVKEEPKIMTSCINLYRLKNEISLDDAITQLAELLNVNRDTPLKPEPHLRTMFKYDSIPFIKYCKAIYKYHRDNFDYFYAYVLVKYLDEKKVLIPICRCYRNQYSFPPVLPGNIQPFFNGHCLMRDGAKPVVILTDSIELAGINQAILDQANIFDIVWISWWSNYSQISNFDWSLLKGHSVYYLIREHSGQGGEIVYNTAKVVKNNLDQIGVKGFKYVSYLFNGVGSKVQSSHPSPFPIVYTVEEFEKAMCCKNPFQPLSLKEFKNDLSQLALNRHMLMSPFINSNSATLICGDHNSGKTWFTLNMSFALSRGERAFEGWCSGGKPTTVLYLYGEDKDYFSFGEKLEIILKIFASKEKIPIELFEKPALPKSNSPLQVFPKKISDVYNFSRFFWNVIDKQRFWTDCEVAEFVNSQVASSGTEIKLLVLDNSQVASLDNQQQTERKLLVLDNLFSDSLESLKIQQILIRELKRRGWAVIIVSTFEKNADLNKLSADNVIRVRKNGCDNGTLEMSIKVESQFKGENRFICKLDFNAAHPTFTKIKNQSAKWPDSLLKLRPILVNDIKSLDSMGFKGQAIADKLGISLSMVKKMKAKFGISTPRIKKK